MAFICEVNSSDTKACKKTVQKDFPNPLLSDTVWAKDLFLFIQNKTAFLKAESRGDAIYRCTDNNRDIQHTKS